MFIEKLTDIQIQQFKVMTPISIEGKRIPYRIVCGNRYMNDPNGSSPYTIFLRDFSCSLSYASKDTKEELNWHFRKFMLSIFKEEYDEALSNYLYRNNSEETLSL